MYVLLVFLGAAALLTDIPSRPVERGGGVFPGPATVGAPSLKNTKKGVPDGFFLT